MHWGVFGTPRCGVCSARRTLPAVLATTCTLRATLMRVRGRPLLTGRPNVCQFSTDYKDGGRLDTFGASFEAVLEALNLAPGHRVRMTQFFQNEARNAARVAHEAMLDAANARARQVTAEDRKREEEVRLLRLRLAELEDELSMAQDAEGAAVAQARKAWQSNEKAAAHARTLIGRASRVVGWRGQHVVHSAYERILRPVLDEWKLETRGNRKARRAVRRLKNRNLALAWNQWVDIVDSVNRLRGVRH